MVRASFALYNTERDVDALVAALTEIGARRDEILPRYERLPNGDYRHRSFTFDPASIYCTRDVVEEWLSAGAS